MKGLGKPLAYGPAVMDGINAQKLLDSLQYNQLTQQPGTQTPCSTEDQRTPTGHLTEDLLELVEDTPFLYDKSHQLYPDQQIRSNRWSEIGHKFGVSGPEILKKWTNIRDRYKRLLNIVLRRREKGEFFQPQWRFFNKLHQMLSHIYLTPAKMQWLALSGGTKVMGQPLQSTASPRSSTEDISVVDATTLQATLSDLQTTPLSLTAEAKRRKTSDAETSGSDCSKSCHESDDNDTNISSNDNNIEDPVKHLMNQMNCCIRKQDQSIQLRLINAIQQAVIDAEKKFSV